MTRDSHPRVVVVVNDVPVREPFLRAKFEAFVQRGWPMVMVRQHAWPTHSTTLAAALWPVALGACFFTNPGGTVRYLRRGAARFGWDVVRRFYLDAGIIAARPDVVHFEFGPLAVGRTSLRDLLGCAVTVSFRGYDLHHVGLGDPAYYADVWRDADGIHFLGEDLWRRAQARGCPPNANHVLIPPAVNTEAFAPAEEREAGRVGTPDRPLRLVSVGRVVWKKGYDYALRSVRLLVDRGVACEYRIVGDGAEFEAVAFARHQLGLGQSVALTGACPPAEIRTHLDWADVFVHAAISEGFCNAVVEAQASALPVVTSDAGGLPENVVDGETGFVVPRREPAPMSERLAQLGADGDLRLRMGAAGRRRAVSLFDLDRQIPMFEAFYAGAAESRSGHAS